MLFFIIRSNLVKLAAHKTECIHGRELAIIPVMQAGKCMAVRTSSRRLGGYL